MKMDLNKLLTDGTSLVPAGMVPRWEVDGERCEQMTVLLGYMHGLPHSRHRESGGQVALA